MFYVFGGAAIKIAAACVYGAIFIPGMFALGMKHGYRDYLKVHESKDDEAAETETASG